MVGDIRMLTSSTIQETAGTQANGTRANDTKKDPSSLLQTLTTPDVSEVMEDLGSLHRASIFENIALKSALASRGIDISSTPATSPLERSPDRGSIPLPEQDASTPNGVASSAGVESTSTRKDNSKQDGPREKNAKALKHLTHGLPSSLAPFFQGKKIQLEGILVK